MSNIKRFHPGIYIKDSLEVMGMTSKEFSMRTGISERTLSAIMNEKGKVTFDVAYKLSVYFDSSINYWINLQNQYDMFLKENEQRIELEDDWKLIKNLKKYLLENDYISNEDDKESIVHKIRKLVGVNNLQLLTKKDSFVCLKKQQSKSESDIFLQNFWIALALNQSRKKKTMNYDKEKLKESINEIRSLIRLDSNVFLPRLQNILYSCGISFVLLPYLSKSNIYGATKWLSKDNVMLAISNRSGKADLFWFTLFHEISHVLMEHRRETLFNIEGQDDIEADKMAADMLIPSEKWKTFIKSNEFNLKTISDFANEIGVLPCVVLGRLHKEKNDIVPYGKFDKQFNVSYKITYK